MKYLGIDYGQKRIGLALGDDILKLATPFKVVGGAEDVLRIIKEEEIDAVVIGIPHRINAGAGEQKKGDIELLIDDFIAVIKKNTDIGVITVDERMTSKAADALSGNMKAGAPRDAVAAMLILQSHLDKFA